MLTLVGRQCAAALRLLLLATLVLGLVYPLAVWGVSRAPGLHERAEGSVRTGADGAPAGSALIGIDPVPADPAADPWFHTRPSASAGAALGPGDPSVSGGSNQGAYSATLLEQVRERRAAIAAREGVTPDRVPPDAVTASGSGLDPQISPAYARLQTPRVARVNGLPVPAVEQLVAAATSARPLGFLGEPGVDVTELNLAVAGARAGRDGG